MFYLTYIKYELDNIIPVKIIICLPWNFTMNINNLNRLLKKSASLGTYMNLLKENLNTTHPQVQIFMDSCVTEDRVGIAIICEDVRTQWKLSNK